TTAPPPEAMEEPDLRPSQLPPPSVARHPSVQPSRPPDSAVLSSAPEPDEFDAMFDKISRPPPKPSTPRAPLAAPVGHAPPPPDLGAASPANGDEDGAILVDGIDVMEIPGLQDLPDDAALELARSARIVTLSPGEEVNAFGVALVTNGAVQLMPTVVDSACFF